MHSLRQLFQRIMSSPVRLAACIVAFMFLLPFAYVLGAFLHIRGTIRPWYATLACLAIVLLFNWALPKFWVWIRSSISVKGFFLHYAADRTVGVSHVEAMMSAGSYAEASTEIDALLAQHGVEAQVCRVALSLHLGKFGSRERGEKLLRRMRNENPSLYEQMATQRLIDVYMGRPETYGKALTELRRLATRFPGTPDAAGAMRAIDELKALQTAEASVV